MPVQWRPPSTVGITYAKARAAGAPNHPIRLGLGTKDEPHHNQPRRPPIQRYLHGDWFLGWPAAAAPPMRFWALSRVIALWGAGKGIADGFRSFLRSTCAPRGQTYMGLECIDLNSYRFKGSRDRRLSWL